VKQNNKLGRSCCLFFAVADHKKAVTEWVFYCGQQRDFKCPVNKCGDKCGPESGCQCTACKELTQLFRTGISGSPFNHPHELMWATVNPYTCSACKKPQRETSRFRCFDCNFDLCASCHNNKDWATVVKTLQPQPSVSKAQPKAGGPAAGRPIWLADSKGGNASASKVQGAAQLPAAPQKGAAPAAAPKGRR